MNANGQSNWPTNRFGRIERGIGISKIIYIGIITRKQVRHPKAALSAFSPSPGRGHFRFQRRINTSEPLDAQSNHQFIAENLEEKKKQQWYCSYRSQSYQLSDSVHQQRMSNNRVITQNLVTVADRHVSEHNHILKHNY